MVVPLTVLIGRLFSSSAASGLLLSFTWYSCLPILLVPAGRIRFWALMALDTSSGEMP